jgi:hypothetical protein
MRRAAFLILTFLGFSSVASAAVITFGTDPFAGSTALTTPGRQVVGGEPFVSFTPGVDIFEFALSAFGPYGIAPNLTFANDVIGNVPSNGANVIVLRTFDDDANPATAFGAGNAANLIASQVTSDGAGFFIYFNSGLNLARLVFSTNLSDNTSDLRILARLTNFVGVDGQTAMSTFTARDFRTAVPEPSTALLLSAAGLIVAVRRRRLR